jgi:hypothetical protein
MEILSPHQEPNWIESVSRPPGGWLDFGHYWRELARNGVSGTETDISTANYTG